MKITERYASAVRSSNLRSQPNTTFSDPDVIAAFGLAAKTAPLGVVLERLFTGDGAAHSEIVRLLSELASSQFPDWRKKGVKLSSIAVAVIKWNRDSSCPACDGLAYEKIPGAPALSDKECPACRGTGRALLHKQFRGGSVEVAEYMQRCIEEQQAEAGAAAMRAIAPRLEF